MMSRHRGMTVMIAAALGWVFLALPLGVLVGQGIRRADVSGATSFCTDDVEQFLREQASAPLD